MHLNQEAFLKITTAASLAPSNLIAKDRISLIEKAFHDSEREHNIFLSSIVFDGDSKSYATNAISRIADYGKMSSGQEALIPYLTIVANDFDITKEYQITQKRNIENFLKEHSSSS